MNLPDLHDLEIAGVHSLHGDAHALAAAAHAAKLRFHSTDLKGVDSKAALLAALSKSFVTSGFDLKQLVRTICRSSTYQLCATMGASNTSTDIWPVQ